MATPEATGPTTGTAGAADATRERSFRLVLIGLIVLIVGFTAGAFANGMYPCVPAAGSSMEPPLVDCATSLSPWAAVAIVGLALALVGYRRSR